MGILKQRLAEALFRSVCSDPEASLERMSAEERGDALQWAGDALAALEAEVPAIAAGLRDSEAYVQAGTSALTDEMKRRESEDLVRAVLAAIGGGH